MPRPDRTIEVRQTMSATRSAERRRQLLLWGACALALVLVAALVTWAVRKDSPALADLSGVQSYDYQAAQHVPGPVTYTEAPPVGGPHNPAWWDCGVYTEPVPNEHAVHSLEHGAVWLTYRPDLPADQLKILTDLGRQEYMLVSPYQGQTSPVVATAWNHQLRLQTADEQELTAFVRTYKQGPQTPEPGAACTGGTTKDLVQRG